MLLLNYLEFHEASSCLRKEGNIEIVVYYKNNFIITLQVTRF